MLLFTCLIILSMISYSQTKQIKGKVTDENGIALPGVSILQSGSKKGTQTDKDGNFTLTLTARGNNLLISSVGYKTEVVNIEGKDDITVALTKDITSGDEVV